MFKFYANENLAIGLVTELRQFGYDIMTSSEAGNANQGIPDDEVLATATTANRCVITFNRDDFLKLHRKGIEHEGIIICKDDPDLQGLATVLHHYLVTQQTLKNRLIRILKTNQPGANQPFFVVREYSVNS